ncbi:molecular chaperone Hsp90 [Streptomyces sp. ICBB 8177]|uniref:sacsin N-terminal ATP-binding-like domain-containing protein n=1 Tax=Streptomyces sp. ICBB 8177 TaxID=563922 RepID=UPI000D684F37|nr:molecular chaperone Hsp90 [Streptomyces sp. ICBB 8177]PWI45884.1 molecular chaperone Hsp90 [Streptomyces sp. ICBB 8177]
MVNPVPAGGADTFGVARLRQAVLDAWAASPARFREDANAEEDLALGGYRDRLVVELAQNAADAAVRAGVPGRLLLTLRDGVLAAANTGAPLDAEGAESLSTLRASAKRGQEGVGRFGVGFSAVLAVSDEPAVVSHGGGVRWSLAEGRELADDAAGRSPGLADELRRRDGHVPLLRLPLPAEGSAPEGYDTVVVLPLRDGAAEDLAARLLDGVDDALLLALPALSEVVIETPDERRVLTQRQDVDGEVVVDDSRSGATRWRVASDAGELDAALLADRPVEERLRPAWSVTWAVPVDGTGAPARPRTASVVHAPTPTDEPLGLPALLIASFPLDPTRRHVAPGPLTDFVLERAADAYVRLLAGWRPVGAGVIDLVPGPLGRGELDGALRGKVLSALPATAFLPAAAATREDGDHALRPDRAELLEGGTAQAVGVLSEVLPALLPAGLERRAELRALGVARLPLGEAIDRLAGTERPATWWRRLYDALAGTDPDRLSGLPVPLTDGRTVVGPRQVLLPSPGTPLPEGLVRLGLKVADPEAAHPLLEKLGATPATPRAVLTTPQVRAAVAGSLDAEEVWDEDAPGLDAEELADLVLALVRDAGLAPGDEPWLGALALPDDEGELSPAGELVYPGSAFEQVIRPGELAACDHDLAVRWGEQPLTAVGVLATFALVRAADVVLDPDDLEPRDADWAEPDDAGLLDAVDVWCEDVLDQLPETDVPPVATELVGVRDLDLVDDDAWPQALRLLSLPPLRDAITAPVRVLLPDGTTRSVRPYTAWWLRDHPVLDGRRPVGLRASGGDPLLAGLYDEADTAAVDDQVLRALGVRTSAAALLDEPGGAAELLSRLADPESHVTSGQLKALYAELALLETHEVTLPDELCAVVDGRTTVVDAADALVADAPDLLPLASGRALLPAGPRHAEALAELFQVRRLSDQLAAPVVSHGEPHEVPDEVRELLPGAPASYVEHEELLVAAADGEQALDWRWADGVLHAATLEGVAAGLAWAAGQWRRRFEVAALLEDPSRAGELATARWFE